MSDLTHILFTAKHCAWLVKRDNT